MRRGARSSRPERGTRMRRLTVIASLVVLCAAAVAPSAASARRSVPPGFVGMVVEGPALEPNISNLEHEMSLMVRSGVESIRAVFPWNDAQPYESFDKVPPSKQGRFRDVHGIPTDFAYTDRIVGTAAER